MLNKFRKDSISWAMYDWANSAFATTVMAGFFPLFFKSYWAIDLSDIESTAMVGYANSLSGLIVVLLAPILGAYSDIGTCLLYTSPSPRDQRGSRMPSWA